MVFLRFLSVEIKIVMLKWLCKTVTNHTHQQLVWKKGLHLKVPHSTMICREIFEICIIKLNKVIKECKSKKFNMSHKLVCFKRSTLFILHNSCLCCVTGRLLWNLIVYYIFLLQFITYFTYLLNFIAVDNKSFSSKG